MSDNNRFGPLDTAEIRPIEALRIAKLWHHTLPSEISEALDAVIQTKNELPPRRYGFLSDQSLNP